MACMRDELERFVASLRIPEDRKAVVLAELADHVACVMETATREGKDPEAEARAALDLQALRRAYEAIEPAFRFSRRHAITRALVAGVLVAALFALGQESMRGVIGALSVLAIMALAAPPRIFELLRVEARAARKPGIGPGMTYAFTALSTPYLIWITLIVIRALGGHTNIDVPWSAFTPAVVMWGVVIAVAVSTRRKALA